MSSFAPFAEPLAIGASTLGLVALLVSAAHALVGFQPLLPWSSDGRLGLLFYLAVGAMLSLIAWSARQRPPKPSSHSNSESHDEIPPDTARRREPQ